MKILSQLSKYCCGLSIKVYNNFADKVQTRILCYFIGLTCSWWSSISSTRNAIVFSVTKWYGKENQFYLYASMACLQCVHLMPDLNSRSKQGTGPKPMTAQPDRTDKNIFLLSVTNKISFLHFCWKRKATSYPMI